MLSLSKLAEQVVSGNEVAVAKALSLVDSGRTEIAELLYPSVKNSRRIGITGSPGVGKSTLVAKMGEALVKKGLKPAVLAIDPTSEITGGALLGDRIRMLGSGFFIRSMATRLRKDGLSPNVYNAAHVLDAAGYSPIIVETVGVGQAAVGVSKLVDIVALVLMPNSGDSVQVEKAGIFEIGDIYVINKADLLGADLLQKELRTAGVETIVQTVANTGSGVTEFLIELGRLESELDLDAVRRKIRLEEVRSAALNLVFDKTDKQLEKLLESVDDKSFPGSVAKQIIDQLSL